MLVIIMLKVPQYNIYVVVISFFTVHDQQLDLHWQVNAV